VKTNHFSTAVRWHIRVQRSLQSLFSQIIFVVSQICISPYLCWFSYIWPIYYTSLKIILFWSYFNLYRAFRAMAIIVNEA